MVLGDHTRGPLCWDIGAKKPVKFYRDPSIRHWVETMFGTREHTRIRKYLLMLVVCALLIPAPTVMASDGSGDAPPELGNGVVAETSPIKINGETELATAASTYGWTGNGSEADPYIIEGLEINGSGSAWCLFLESIDEHVVIRNSRFFETSEEADPTWNMAGIVIRRCTNITIENNTVEDNRLNGISLWFSDALVRNNTLQRNGYGIKVLLGDGGTLEGNTLVDNSYGIYSQSYPRILNNTFTAEVWSNGIYVQRYAPRAVSGNTLSNLKVGLIIYSRSNATYDNNTIRNCTTGINVYTESVTLAHNTVEDCPDGIYLGSWGTTLVGNTLRRCAITSYPSRANARSHTILSSNTVDDKPVLYQTDQSNVDVQPTNYGQVIIANCSGVSLNDRTIDHAFWLTCWQSDNVTIEGNLVDPDMPVKWSLRSTEDIRIRNNSIGDVYLYLRYIERIEFSSNSIDGGRTYIGAETDVSVHNNSIVAYSATALTVLGGSSDGNAAIMDNNITMVDPGIGAYALSVSDDVMTFALRNNHLWGAGLSTGWAIRDHHNANFDVDMSNTVNGRPILYLKSLSDRRL